jgi:hypothetical protein
LIGFIAAQALSPLHQLSSYEISGEKFHQPTSTLLPVYTVSPSLTMTPTVIYLSTPTMEPPGSPTATPLPATGSESPTPWSTEPSITLTPTKTRLPTDTPTTQPLPSDTPVPTPPPDVLLEIEYPEKIEIGRSDSIRITLFRTQQQTWVATIEGTEHVVTLASPQSVGTPDSPIEEAFGPEYTGCAKAYLDGQAFDIGELTPECQPLEQPSFTWDWSIMPKSDAQGLQVINIRIEGRWESLNTDSKVQRELFRSRFEVQITKPITAYINIASIITSIVGSGFSVNWLSNWVKESKENKKKQGEDKSKNVLP